MSTPRTDAAPTCPKCHRPINEGNSPNLQECHGGDCDDDQQCALSAIIYGLRERLETETLMNADTKIVSTKSDSEVQETRHLESVMSELEDKLERCIADEQFEAAVRYEMARRAIRRLQARVEKVNKPPTPKMSAPPGIHISQYNDQFFIEDEGVAIATCPNLMDAQRIQRALKLQAETIRACFSAGSKGPVFIPIESAPPFPCWVWDGLYWHRATRIEEILFSDTHYAVSIEKPELHPTIA